MLIMNNIYDFKSIGERIRKERKELGMNQDQLASALNISSRQTIAKWENGSAIPQLEDMLNMCNLFCCELGYLLCEHDLKTREATDIHNLTGLSKESIEYLEFANEILKDNHIDDVYGKAHYDIVIRTINFLLECEYFDNSKYHYILSSIAEYLYCNFNHYYDDSNVDNEEYYNHVAQLGFWDKKLGVGTILNNEIFTKSLLLELEDKLLHAREHLQNNLPDRITPLYSECESE